MATLQEVRELFSHSGLYEKAEAAVVIEAKSLLSGAPSLPEKKWSNGVLLDPSVEARKALRFVVSANSTATVEQITGASDTLIQANVSSVIGHLVDALEGV